MNYLVQCVAARESWLMHGKTVDNLNEALRSASEIDSSNVTYLREKYSTSVSILEKHITEANVVPLVLREEGLVIHTVSLVDNDNNIIGSKVYFLDLVTGIKHDNLTIDLDGYRITNSPCIIDTPNLFGNIKKVLALVAFKSENGKYDSIFRLYTFSGISNLIVEKHLNTDYLNLSLNDKTKYFFSTPLVPVYANKIPSLRNKNNPFINNSTSRVCVLVGINTDETWYLDVNPLTNNLNELKNYTTGTPFVPLGINDIYYKECEESNRGFLFDDCISKYVLQTGGEGCPGVTQSSKGTDCKSSIYNLLNGDQNNECGKLLCIDVDIQIDGDGDTEFDTYSGGELLWFTDTCPDPIRNKKLEEYDEDCECVCIENKVMNETYFNNELFDQNGNLQKQTHILIHSVMKPGDVAIGFEKNSKEENESRIFPGNLMTHDWEDEPNPNFSSIYVAWIRTYQEAKTEVNYSPGNNIFLNVPLVTQNSNQTFNNSCYSNCTDGLRNNASYLNVNGNGNIYGTETINQTIVTYPRRKDGSYEFDETHPEYDVLVFAKLTDILPLWNSNKMGGQGAGRTNISGKLNSPFTENYTLKRNQATIIECDDNYRAGRVFKVTDKFDNGLFVFNWISLYDKLNSSQKNSLEYRGAGVTGMPIVDIDDARIHFGTGRRNQIPLDSVYLENGERLITIRECNTNYYFFDASRYSRNLLCNMCCPNAKTGTTGKNEDALALLSSYHCNKLVNIFGPISHGKNSIYQQNLISESKRNSQFYYNSLVTVKLNSNSMKNTNGLWGKKIRIWDALVTDIDTDGKPSNYFTFRIDNDIQFDDDDFKRIPINSIPNRVLISRPEYHEITTGAHVHYNIATRCADSNKTTNFVSVITKGGLVAFVQNNNPQKRYDCKGVFMCGIPRADIIHGLSNVCSCIVKPNGCNEVITTTPNNCNQVITPSCICNQSCIAPTIEKTCSKPSGGEGGNKYGSVADQFFLYILMPNLAGFTLTRNNVYGDSLSSCDSIVPSIDDSFAIKYEPCKAYIICYDLNAISNPPACIPNSSSTGNIYHSEKPPYITAYIADTDLSLAGNITGSLDLLIVPSSRDKLVRIYSKNDVLGTLDPHHGNVRVPSTTIVPRYQLTYSAKSFSGVVVAYDSLYIQGGVHPTDAKNTNWLSPYTSQNFRCYSIEY